MSQLGNYFDHGADRIGYNPGSDALPEYTRDEGDNFFEEACPTLLAYLNHSMQDIHVALAQVSVDTRLATFPPDRDGLLQTADVVQKYMVPQMLDALTTAACVGSGALTLKVIDPPVDRKEFLEVWEALLENENCRADIDMIKGVYATDSDLMVKVTECLGDAARTVLHNGLGDNEDALDIWHRGAHLATVATYLIGFEMGKKMSFDSKVGAPS